MRSRLTVSLVVLASACTQIPDQLDSPQFDFTKHALSFANFGDRFEAGKFNQALAIRMFGAEAVCQPNMTECVVDPNVQAFIDDVNSSLATGHSEGFAVMAQLFALGKLKASDFGAERPSTLTLNDVALVRELAYFSATQRIEAVHAQDQKLDAKGAMPFLASLFKQPSDEAWRVLVAIKRDDGRLSAGHALVPFGYFRGANEGHYVVRLYDPNFPQEERRMDVDVKANTWRYDGTINSMDPLVYEGNPTNQNLLYFSPVTPRLGAFTPPHLSEGFAVTVSGGTGLITGADNEVGFQDGRIVEKGGLVLPGASNCACSNSNETVQLLLKKAGLPQVVAVTATGATVSGNSVTIQVNQSVTGNGKVVKTEEISVTADGKAVVTHKNPVENDERSVTVTTKNKDGSTTTVTVKTSGNTESLTIDTNDPNNVKVSGKSTPGNASQVEVTVTSTQADGTSKTVTSTSSGGGGREVNVTAQPNAGTISATTALPADSCKNKRRDTNEIGIDCGAACAMQPPANRIGSGRCARYQRCESSADCETADSCVNGVCFEPRCDDRVKNGQETDVDCGATGCGGCGLGKVCTASTNCGNGLLCDNGLCAEATPLTHRLTVSGLGPFGRIELTHLLDGTFGRRTLTGNATGAPFDVTISAAKTLRVSLKDYSPDFFCAFDGPRDDATWYWAWEAPSSGGAGMSSRRSITCYRTGGTVEVPFVINGCQFARASASADGGLYINAQRAPKFFDNTQMPPTEMWWVKFYADTRGLNRGSLTQQVSSRGTAGGTPPRYDITIGPDTSGFYQFDNGWRTDPDSDTRFTMSCLPDAPLTGTLGVQSTTTSPRVFCTCTTTYADGGMVVPDAGARDAGVDAGIDAGSGVVDAGFDAGRPDAGSPDAGRPDAGSPDAGRTDAGVDAGPVDAGPVDAGPVDAGPAGCSIDSQCGAQANCFCASNPGNCAGAGVCIGTKAVFSTPTTNGVAASGTFTVPAGCSRVHVSAWGAAGGKYQEQFPFPIQLAGGGGGFASGSMSAAPGDVLTVWIGAAGVPTSGIMGGEGIGSYAGTAANGGGGDGLSGGGGGGLTSVRQTGSATRVFAIPGGAGAASTGIAEAGGASMSGGAPGRAGQSAMSGSMSGGGGAGDPGGTAGMTNMAGLPGAFGTLPSGITSSMGNTSNPGGTARYDYGLCPSQSGQGMSGGNGCVVVRCAQ
jgi:hypothetical protein